MSDFIFSRKQMAEGFLVKNIASIYHEDPPETYEFHGKWGTLAVSENLYYGYQPYETDEHICVVLGGPLLYFGEVSFISDKNDRHTGTKAIYERWLAGEMKWTDDLSGPFAVCIVDKNSGEALFVTDLMSFIPLYEYSDQGNVMVASHSDALAESCGQVDAVDLVSKVDFILHGVITYPYTVYQAIRQMAPASEFRLGSGSAGAEGAGAEDTGESGAMGATDAGLVQQSYWEPLEKAYPHSMGHAAEYLRDAIETDINKILGATKNVAQFLSGGEDSRTISSLLSSIPDRDAFIFLDQMNREGKVAEKAAEAYRAKFHLATRDQLHYLNIIPDCADLIGDGAQYFHAHTFGFHKKCELQKYDAVFGGLFSDALLKGARIKKIRGSTRLPFLPQMKNNGYSPAKPIKNSLIKDEILAELNARRAAHYEYVKRIRPTSAEEWFELWPSSMNMNIPNLHANRRLFRSYEPFMSKEVVKMSAVIPQKWKLNRRLFHKFAKPYLRETKWLLHSEGKLPYANWIINIPIVFVFWIGQEIGKRIGVIKGNQGPWASWGTLMNSKEWRETLERYSGMDARLSEALTVDDIQAFYNNPSLNYVQRINLMQTLYYEYKALGQRDRSGVPR